MGLSKLIFKSERNFEVYSKSEKKAKESYIDDKEINWWFID